MIISWEDFTWLVPWVNHGKILRDLHLDLIMGTFYGTCNASPVVKWIVYMGRFYVRSKYLRKIFPYNRNPRTIIRWGFMCELWPHVKSPQVNNRLHSGLTLLKFDSTIHRDLWPYVKSSHIIGFENTIIRWGFMCELWPHIKSPQVTDYTEALGWYYWNLILP